MAARQGAELRLRPDILRPGNARVRHLFGMTLGPPDNQHWTLDRVPGLNIGTIHLEIDGCPGTVVFAHCVQLLRRAAPSVLGDGLWTKTALANPHGGEL